jgi:hypothetical protein
LQKLTKLENAHFRFRRFHCRKENIFTENNVDFIGRKVKFFEQKMVAGSRQSESHNLRTGFVNVDNRVYFDAAFAFAIFGFSPRTFQNFFEKSDCCAVKNLYLLVNHNSLIFSYLLKITT